MCQESENQNKFYYLAYVWDESSEDKDQWRFVPIKSEEFLTKKDCK